MYSFMIRQALLIDGSGGGPYRADLALEGGRIARIAPQISGRAEREIGGTGLAAAPGFIDIHSHTDGSIFRNPGAESQAMQGVTTQAVGNCGIGAFPINPERKETLADFLKIHEFYLPEEGMDWTDLSGYAPRLEALGLGINLAPLVGHGALRIAAMGAEDRRPDPAELEGMKKLLEQALKEGAWGMSTGLIYPPGSFSQTEELIFLARVLARCGAVYTSHIRGESATLMAALDEAVRIGRESGARIEVSHLKAMGMENWGRGREILRLLEEAREKGIDIGADQYPYAASSTSLSALIPPWAHAGGVSELLKRLSSPALDTKIREGITKEMSLRGGPEKVMVAGIYSSRNAGFSGKTLAQIAKSWSCSGEEAVVRLLREEEGTVGAIFFSMAEKDVDAIAASDGVAVGSDGRGMDPEKDSGESTHPRSYGTFVRVLGHYVREKKLLSLSAAVRKMSGLPAERLGFPDRGRLKEGYAADLVLFDPAAVGDRATFIHPHQYARGIVCVWVNGRLSIEDGKFTGKRAGRVLLKES